MTPIEKRIVLGLAQHLAAAGWHCTRKDPVADVEATGLARIYFTRNGVRCWILFIEGNGEDIISDFGAELDRDVNAYIDEREARLIAEVAFLREAAAALDAAPAQQRSTEVPPGTWKIDVRSLRLAFIILRNHYDLIRAAVADMPVSDDVPREPLAAVMEAVRLIIEDDWRPQGAPHPATRPTR